MPIASMSSKARLGCRRPPGAWVLWGTTSHERYVERPERDALVARQPPPGTFGGDAGGFHPHQQVPGLVG
ncbi:MAG: hypothetical protein ACRD12_08390, partial [Acidimicrobiales bacterium]